MKEVNYAITYNNDEEKVAPWTVSLGDNDDNGLHNHLCTGIIIKGSIQKKEEKDSCMFLQMMQS